MLTEQSFLPIQESNQVEREMADNQPQQARQRGPTDAGYVITRGIGYGLIWLGILLLGAATMARALARWL